MNEYVSTSHDRTGISALSVKELKRDELLVSRTEPQPSSVSVPGRELFGLAAWVQGLRTLERELETCAVASA